MLRMGNILFDHNGAVKVQDMSHLFFDEFQIKPSDLIFLPPEALKGGSLNQKGSRRNQGQNTHSKLEVSNSMDIWTLGMVMLHCMSLSFLSNE